MRVAVVGGGIAGVTAAWELHRLGVSFSLFEASARLGGTVETVRRGGFVVECGPDGWVSEKPWARELAVDLGLAGELIGSNDAGRVTYIVQRGGLVAMPDGMRMMVPTDVRTLEGSTLFSEAARAAYASEALRGDELRASAPIGDESVASFVRRHFGEEVLRKIGGPLLSGVFGGDVAKLSVRAVMPRFVAMEREQGSLVAALAGKGGGGQAVFTSLKSGVGTLVERMAGALPAGSVRLGAAVDGVARDGEWWVVGTESFDAVLVAVPAHGARGWFGGRMEELLTMEASSAVLAALCFDEEFAVPKGFGFLAPEGEGSELLAGTFVDQKFAGRVPAGGRMLRGFYGGAAAGRLAGESDAAIAEKTLADLRALLGALPEPSFAVVRRWPRSLPQYEVGHLERVAELDSLVAEQPGLWLLGNAYKGVGLPDLVREARAAARAVANF